MSNQSHKFQEGDLVRLKSGGPTMTVQQYNAAGGVNCVWFNDRDERCSDNFAEGALVLAEEEE